MGKIVGCGTCGHTGIRTDYMSGPPYPQVLCEVCDGHGKIIVLAYDPSQKRKLAAVPAIMDNPPKPPPPEPPPRAKIIV